MVKWVSLSCTLDYKWVTGTDGVKFKFNDTISYYTKNDSERRWSDYNNYITKYIR